ncbi:MAG: hypothetical protein ACXWVG_12000, partial [Telluria sp.]
MKRPMPALLKSGLIALPFFGACWGGAIWYWRASDRMPATSDIVLYLLALPLGLLLALWLGRKLIAPSAPVPATNRAAEASPVTTAQSTALSLAIIAASLRSRHGASVEELSTAIAEDKARADLDNELVDDDGFPIMAARSDDAVDEALQEEVTKWLNDNGMPHLSFSDEQWRALTIATEVAGELASHATGNLIPAEGAAPMLHLFPLLPPEWRIEHRGAIGMWLKHTVVQFGWPVRCLSLNAEIPSHERAITPSVALERLAQPGATADSSVTAMIVACASYIGEETVDQWAADKLLFTSSRPQGSVPGEGAAGVLLTDVRQAKSIAGATFAVLDPVGKAQRDSSADDVKRVDASLLTELVERAVKHGGINPADVGFIVSDTGQRSNRTLELMGLVSAAMPHLDGSTDVVRLGVALGTCGAVPFVSALGLALHHVLQRQEPVLC